ncbi:S-adenosyl-L-methionine-dependent methyltransferase [Multifurca ochricompacta]|uniref:S-adenosyl-L-methionine-dependent methyltransferase n=1 Tax=Multifurca ochricompacta TaxID=376703 RepID=A0AAD4LWI3_9AGAM|nr:S-adenosyl-L-methionine-dependent methyltransferase [Multifurca ochricompacta]
MCATLTSDDFAGRDASGWSATVYRNTASYVFSSEATEPILQLLGALQGERILDFGCGSGEVTAKIMRLVGREGVVVGVDMSEGMIERAREITMLPTTHLIVGDTQGHTFLEEFPPNFVGKCDRIFSNAVLHWCNRDPVRVLVNAHKILRVGGLFVAEMGGHGNVAEVRNALHAALRKRGIDPVARDPWFFPTIEKYMELLKSAYLRPLHTSLQPRPTPVDDLVGWIRLFGGHNFLKGIEPREEQLIVEEVVETCRKGSACRWDEVKKLWYLDYVRLRIVAVKMDDHIGLRVG